MLCYFATFHRNVFVYLFLNAFQCKQFCKDRVPCTRALRIPNITKGKRTFYKLVPLCVHSESLAQMFKSRKFSANFRMKQATFRDETKESAANKKRIPRRFSISLDEILDVETMKIIHPT